MAKYEKAMISGRQEILEGASTSRVASMPGLSNE